MELRHLRYFIAVADELSFTRAAERLGTAQPSLSQQIRDLEEEIGTPLFTRTRRKVELTEAGRAFRSDAQLVIEQAARAVAHARRIGERSRAMITIGFVPAAEVQIFPAILPRLRMEYPEINVELRSLLTYEQESLLTVGGIDVAFMRGPIDAAVFESEVVLEEPMMVILPASHRLAQCEEIAPEQLDGETFVATDPLAAGQVHKVVEAYFEAYGIRPRTAQIANNILLNLNLISMGLGLGLLPAYTASLINRSSCARPLAGEAPVIPLYMVWRRGEHTPELEALLTIAREQLLTRAQMGERKSAR
ncbi:LysR substrate-binding domain-containing protein [Paraburkholderia atlantica]|uniref:LysR substrate-binding domain-containing protein n=1 Tax=Paraburkholderia atlantica TaxID=2654982 RepID=UPI003D24C060